MAGPYTMGTGIFNDITALIQLNEYLHVCVSSGICICRVFRETQFRITGHRVRFGIGVVHLHHILANVPLSTTLSGYMLAAIHAPTKHALPHYLKSFQG